MPGPSNTLRVFASKPFLRFARRFGISDAELWQAVQEDCDADLGGGVFKFRLARLGEGTSGGARATESPKESQQPRHSCDESWIARGANVRLREKGYGQHQKRRVASIPQSN